MNNKSLTFTIIANMTANYGESLGNISSVQKIYKNGVPYSVRSWESIKSMLMQAIGFDEDLVIMSDNSVATKKVGVANTLETCKNLEGGYMSATKECTNIRKSSFRITNAIATHPLVGDYQFHNNLKLAQKFAKDNNINLQKEAGKAGLMPYNYEYDKCLRIYSITIFLDEIGEDENFNIHLSNEEKLERILALVNGIRNLSLEVKGNLDNAEPLFIVGGLSPRKTHIFENMVQMKENTICLGEDFIDRVSDYHAGIMSNIFDNENEVKSSLNATTIDRFFNTIEDEVRDYFK